jgi:hypothetical protein
MRKPWAAWLIIGIGAVLWALAGAVASEARSGEWTMQRSDAPGAVTLSLRSSRSGNSFHTSSDWPKADFAGLDFSRTSTQEVSFTLTRDAGNFNFEGVLRNGAGAGSFQFSPDARYVQQMKALGFAGVEDEQMAFALHDVSLEFARDMKSENLLELDTDKLLAFRIHGVTRKFIDELKAAGQSERNSDRLIAFRIHGVTPEMVQRLRTAGYTPESDDLIALRIHGATPEWMEQLKQRGYADASLEQLVAFRIHGVSPEFIGELQQLGFQRPLPGQLVSMRIHGVTPGYIGQLRARGIKDLTIEKLVALKIHGID